MHRIIQCDKSHYAALVPIWERSVRATHTFLDEEAIAGIRALLIPHYFPAVNLYALLVSGTPVGFIGLHGAMIEMLFVDSSCLRRGYGTLLIRFALERGATQVDVNLHNPSALAFYRAHGFRIVGRDDTDEAGRPYPVLHLSL